MIGSILVVLEEVYCLLLAGLQRIEDVKTAIEASPKAFGKGELLILFSTSFSHNQAI